MLARTAAVTAALALLAAVAWADAVDGRIAKGEPPLQQRLGLLQSRYRRPITAYLTQIHHKRSAEQDRYLILWRAGRSELYVQCAFFDDDQQIHCEAVSGYYGEPIAGFITPAKLTALAALCFSTDASAGNFVRERPVPDGEALYDVAGCWSRPRSGSTIWRPSTCCCTMPRWRRPCRDTRPTASATARR